MTKMTYIPEGAYVSARQAAGIRGVSKRSIHQWIDKGWLPALVIDNFILIVLSDLEKVEPKKAGWPKGKTRKA